MEHKDNEEELKYFNRNYRFNNALFVSLILNQILQFLDGAECFSLCRLRRSNQVLQNRAEYHPRDDVLGFVAIDLGNDKLF